jgi:hypothetical protein
MANVQSKKSGRAEFTVDTARRIMRATRAHEQRTIPMLSRRGRRAPSYIGVGGGGTPIYKAEIAELAGLILRVKRLNAINEYIDEDQIDVIPRVYPADTPVADMFPSLIVGDVIDIHSHKRIVGEETFTDWYTVGVFGGTCSE